MIRLCKKCNHTWDIRDGVRCPQCNYYESWTIGEYVSLLKPICERCGYTWVTMTNTPPKNCPKCNSPYWNIPRGSSRFTPISSVTRSRLYCQQCGHTWIARSNNLPRDCPNCDSPCWYKPRFLKKKSSTKKEPKK